MKNIILFLVLTLFITSCSNPLSSSEESPTGFAIQNTEDGKVLLRLKPEIGEKTGMQMKVELKPSGMMIPLNSTITADVLMRVAASTDSLTSYHIDFQRIQMIASVLGAKVNYDSQGDNSMIPAEIRNQVEPLLAKKVVMQMDPLARVKSFEFDENRAANSNIDLNALFIPLPEKEVGTGDSWTATQDVQNVENARLIYTIDRISDTEVLVKVAQPDQEHITSKVQGEYLIDRKTGFTKDGVLEIETTQNGQGINIKITVDSVESVVSE